MGVNNADRRFRLDAAIARATARGLGGSPEDWPVLVRFPETGQRRIDRLHERSDWVVTNR
jgi:DNA phosphorothioation-dependent restriction protein DptH